MSHFLISHMYRLFEKWNAMKQIEPRKFWSAETFFFCIYAKSFPYTISHGESQTLLLRFFLTGGGVCTQVRGKD